MGFNSVEKRKLMRTFTSSSHTHGFLFITHTCIRQTFAHLIASFHVWTSSSGIWISFTHVAVRERFSISFSPLSQLLDHDRKRVICKKKIFYLPIRAHKKHHLTRLSPCGRLWRSGMSFAFISTAAYIIKQKEGIRQIPRYFFFFLFLVFPPPWFRCSYNFVSLEFFLLMFTSSAP